jgi:hypothetical protein
MCEGQGEVLASEMERDGNEFMSISNTRLSNSAQLRRVCAEGGGSSV